MPYCGLAENTAELPQYRQHVCLQHGTVHTPLSDETSGQTQTRFAPQPNRTSVANLFVPMGHLLC